jgi:hypothetical protein
VELASLQSSFQAAMMPQNCRETLCGVVIRWAAPGADPVYQSGLMGEGRNLVKKRGPALQLALSLPDAGGTLFRY